MRLYFKVLGGHTHISIFVGKRGGTLGKAGDLTMTNEEFTALKDTVSGGDAMTIELVDRAQQ